MLIERFRQREREPWSKQSGAIQTDSGARTAFLADFCVTCGHALNHYPTHFMTLTVPSKYSCTVNIPPDRMEDFPANC
ncbi:MAG TPA: hypothetical protein VGV68_02415 [Terriglobia bacterium]|nr:hypothetical protein [Terriglobia bacterium]